MSKEIEVKARVKDLAETEKRLAALGCAFSAPVSQDDTTFCNYPGRYADYPAGSNFLRIRVKSGGGKNGTGESAGSDKENRKVIFTAKRPETKKEMVKMEHETVIADPDEMRAIIGMLGYREGTHVVKKRRTAKLGEYEICLDEVERLGSFIEVEKMAANEHDASPVLAELIAFLGKIGIDPKDRVTEGYDIMIANLDGK